MAENSKNPITYFIKLKIEYKAYLYDLRCYSKLELAFEHEFIWLKNLTKEQLNLLEVKIVPDKEIFYEKNQQLFPYGSLLPKEKIKPNLNWLSLEKALPVSLPKLNNNLFEIKEKLSINIIPSQNEEESIAILTDFKTLKPYIEKSPSIRLKNLSWVLINEEIFIFGKPLLPIQGKVFWKAENSFLPSGYDFDIKSLASSIAELVNPQKDCWIIWQEDSSYILINKKTFRPLSLSSFRQTEALIKTKVGF